MKKLLATLALVAMVFQAQAEDKSGFEVELLGGYLSSQLNGVSYNAGFELGAKALYKYGAFSAGIHGDITGIDLKKDYLGINAGADIGYTFFDKLRVYGNYDYSTIQLVNPIIASGSSMALGARYKVFGDINVYAQYRTGQMVDNTLTHTTLPYSGISIGLSFSKDPSEKKQVIDVEEDELVEPIAKDGAAL